MTGANRPDLHLRGVEPGRDFSFERADVRTVVAGDTVNGSAIRIEPAIEVGEHLQARDALLGAARSDATSTSTAGRS